MSNSLTLPDPSSLKTEMAACLLLKVILSLGVPHSFTVSWDVLAGVVVVVELLDAMVDDIADVVIDGSADVVVDGAVDVVVDGAADVVVDGAADVVAVVDGAAVGLTEQYQLSKWLAESSIAIFNI